MITYMGVDLHFRQITHHMIIKDDNGIIGHEKGTILTTEMEKQFIPLLDKNTHICVEASTCTYEFIDRVKDFVGSISVVNPQDFKEIYCSGKKTDKIDARKLANRLKTHIEDNDPEDGFPLVYVPDKKTQELRKLFSTYGFVNKQIVALKNRIASILRSHFIAVNKNEIRGNFGEWIQKSGLERLEIVQITLLHEQLELLEKQKNVLRKEIVGLGKICFPREIALLISVQGIGEFTACALMADIADINRFKNHKKLVSYLRSAPRVMSSDQVTRGGAIDKRGRKLSFSLLLQGISHYKRTNPILGDFYERKTKGKSKGKVRAAIVRKMIVVIFYMLKNNEMYRFSDEGLYDKKFKKSQAAA